MTILVWTASAAFVASWFMPVLVDVPGWMAFRYSLAPLIPYGGVGNLSAEDSVPQVLSGLTNVVFIVMAALWITNQRMRAGLFVRISLACFLLNLYWPVKAIREGGLRDILFGYYAWEAAFAALLAVAVMAAVASRRTSSTPTAGTPS
jgi:membrane associated rhomboid family serine protease